MPAVHSTLADAYQVALRAKHKPPEAWPDAQVVETARQILSGAVTGTAAGPLQIEWTTWASVKDPSGNSITGTWESLVLTLSAWSCERYPTKAACPGWAPVRFDLGRRHDDAVECIYALTLDCDDHGDWTRTLAELRDRGIAYLAHRSPSHGIDGCKWRLVLPLAQTVSGEHIETWREWYTAARVVLGAVGGCWYDPSCSNPSRLWYPPVAIGKAPDREVLSFDGAAIDLALIAEAVESISTTTHIPLPLGQRVRTAEAARGQRMQVVASPVERAERWLACVEPAIEGQGGDRATFRVACAMVRDFDLSDADALSLLERWNSRCSPPWSSAQLAQKIANARKYGTNTEGAKLDVPLQSQSPWRPAVATSSETPRHVLEPEADGPRDEVGDPIKAKGPGRIRWVKMTDKGAPVACVENTQAMLDHYNVRVRYNLMTHEDEYETPSLTGAADKRQNASVAQIREWARRHGMSAGPVLDDHLTLLVEASPFHPAAEWIRSKPWDGVDRIEALFATLVLTSEDLERRALMRRLFDAWIATAAHAALVPPAAREGVAAQLVLVIQGPQGVRKTRWIQSLAPDGSGWVRAGVNLDPSNRDSVQQATNAWIVELGELDATFRKADVAALKAHLTSRTDTYRAAYARKAETVARRTVYAATVNEKGVLHDDTGSRRFAVVAVQECNPEHGIDMQQVWAQAATFGREACFLRGEDERKMLEVNREHETTDPLAELLAQRWEVDETDMPGWRSLKAILEGIDQHRQWTTGDSKSVARALKNRMKARSKVKDGYTLFAVSRRPE